MKPITLRIFNDITDAYYYMGKLFVLTSDGYLKFIEQWFFFQKYIVGKDIYDNELLSQVLFNNDQLESPKKFNEYGIYYDHFSAFWEKTDSSRFEVKIHDDDLTTICPLPISQSLDFIIYAQRAFIGNRDGLYECQLTVEGDTVAGKGFLRVFEGKSININARIGQLLISTKQDGLFAGSIVSLRERLQIRDQAIERDSVRTGWANYNFINYRNDTEADYFVNEIQNEDSDEAITFKADDGGYRNQKITQFAVEKTALTARLAKASRQENIIFAFNSLTKSFTVSDKGKIYYTGFLEQNGQFVELGNFQAFRDIAFDIPKLGYPLSAHTVAGGTIYEFFDQVILVKGGVMENLSAIECKQIRSFASSKWYKNVVLTLSEDCLECHSIHPYI